MKMIPPGSTIGILGGGQLGRMLAVAAAEMGYHTHIYCPEVDAPASEVSRHTTLAAYDDEKALKSFAAQVDVVTLEFENIPLVALETLAPRVPVHPSVRALEICQHRVKEKQFLRGLGIGTAPFQPVSSREELRQALNAIGFPGVLKTCMLGYDGKGQLTLRSEDGTAGAEALLSQGESIYEGFVDFSMEISVIVARREDGQMACYPPVHNIHRHHILHQTIAPAPVSQALAARAQDMARQIAGGLQLVGILAVEMFVTKDHELLVNELAPRPHNSGHWTMDACLSSQFDQTVRAVCGLPLGSCEPLAPAVMTNLIGDEVNAWPRWLENPVARLHLYGKAEARPGRKMGHVTELKG